MCETCKDRGWVKVRPKRESWQDAPQPWEYETVPCPTCRPPEKPPESNPDAAEGIVERQ